MGSNRKIITEKGVIKTDFAKKVTKNINFILKHLYTKL